MSIAIKPWRIVAAVAAFAVIGIVVFLATFDIARYRGAIQDRAAAALGREVRIGGIRLGFSLTPTIVLTDVALANASWGSRSQMAAAKEVEVTLELLPLVAGQVNVDRISVQGADVLLEIDAQGRANWELHAPDGQGPGAAAPQPGPTIGVIEGADLRLTYRDGRAGRRIDATAKSIAARMSGPLAELNVSRLDVGDLVVTRQAGRDSLRASVGKAQFAARGPLADLAFTKVEVADVKVAGAGERPLDAAISRLTLDGAGALDVTGTYQGSAVKANGTLALASLKGGGKALPVKLAVEGLGLRGNVDLLVDTGRSPLRIGGRIVVPKIDLAAFSAPAAGAGRVGGEAARGPLLSNEPLPWDALNAVDADLDVSIGTLKPAAGPPLGNLALPVKLTNGRLIVDGATIEVAGGRIDARLDADAAHRTVAFKGSAKGLTAEAIARAYGRDVIAGEPLDLALDVRGRGASTQAIAASLDGSLLGGMGESRISNAALNIGGGLQTVLQVITTANPLARQEPYTAAKCAVLNFRITGGVARTRDGLAFITDKVQATGSGTVDLGHNRIDLIVRPTVSGALGAQIGKLASTIRVSGTIDEPKIGVDAASTAKAVAGLAAGVATGGAAGALLGLEAGSGGGRRLREAIGSVLGGDRQKQPPAATGGDICTIARTRRQE